MADRRRHSRKVGDEVLPLSPSADADVLSASANAKTTLRISDCDLQKPICGCSEFTIFNFTGLRGLFVMRLFALAEHGG